MKTLENIKATELNENEMTQAAGGNVVYVDGLYCVYNGNGKLYGIFDTHREAKQYARACGLSTYTYWDCDDYFDNLSSWDEWYDYV